MSELETAAEQICHLNCLEEEEEHHIMCQCAYSHRVMLT